MIHMYLQDTMTGIITAVFSKKGLECFKNAPLRHRGPATASASVISTKTLLWLTFMKQTKCLTFTVLSLKFRKLQPRTDTPLMFYWLKRIYRYCLHSEKASNLDMDMVFNYLLTVIWLQCDDLVKIPR